MSRLGSETMNVTNQWKEEGGRGLVERDRKKRRGNGSMKWKRKRGKRKRRKR